MEVNKKETKKNGIWEEEKGFSNENNNDGNDYN